MLKAGQRLKEVRLEKGLTLEQAEKATKIRKSFLEALERSDYKSLPSSAYAKGFVVSYASYLGVSEREIVPLFKREFDDKREVTVLPEGFTRQKPLPRRPFRVRRTVVVTILLFLLVLGFIFFQFRHVIFNPALRIYAPQENATTGQTVSVIGRSDPDTTVTVDGESVNVDDAGHFRKDITVFPGKNTVTVMATNRFNKETTIERHIDTK